jgi:uncharacterized protein (DUF2461 family)
MWRVGASVRAAFVAGESQTSRRSPKVDYRRIPRAPNFRISRLARREQEATPAKEWMTMIALVEGHPNIDALVFYLLMSTILAATLYYFHRRQTE